MSSALRKLEGDRKWSTPHYKDSIINNLAKIQHRNNSLKNAWVIQERDYLLISEPVLERQGYLGDFSRNKIAGRYHFLSPPPDKTQTPEGTSTVPTVTTYLANRVLCPPFSPQEYPLQHTLGRSFPK